MLGKYYNKTTFSNDLLEVIDIDIQKLNDPYNQQVKYAGRGDSRKWTLSGWLVPEFTYNKIFYIHDMMYILWKKGVVGYSKKLADRLMYQLLKIEGFIFAYPYYLGVKYGG